MDGGGPAQGLSPEAAEPQPMGLYDRLLAAVARPDLQRRLARLPGIAPFARREGRAVFDLVSGFVQSQVLVAAVETGLLDALQRGPRTETDLCRLTGLEADRLAILLRAAAALRLVRRLRHGRMGLGRRGAAILGVPGLIPLIRHHPAFYSDLADPVALLRSDGPTELAALWPYVLGPGAAIAPETAERYSALMAESQALVAADALPQADLGGARRLLDVGGGTGAFVAAALARHRGLQAGLLDLPAVIAAAGPRLAASGLASRVTLHPGSFRTDPLPSGYDAISLVRVLYDHDAETVRALLLACRRALPPGGRLVIAEPMLGRDRPEPAGDVYYALYTLAMGTGQTRSASAIGGLLAEAGFDRVAMPRPRRAFVTSVVRARVPG